MKIRSFTLLMLSTAQVVWLSASPAAAQDRSGASESATADDGLNEIVVTAQRREERQQDVPVSITTLDNLALEGRQVVDMVSLTKSAPGFLARTTLSPLEITASMRGVTQLLPGIVLDPGIGTYVDGVYNVINAGSNLGMIDMERVEVLKGPQGTLFGRNTIGGAISITTAKPTGRFGGYASAKVGNYGAQTFTGVINVPVAPGVVDARIVYQHNKVDGYGHNLTTGGRTQRLNQDYVRGSVKITPADGWEILAQAYYTDSNGTPAATRLAYIDPAASIFGPGQTPNNILIPIAHGNFTDQLSNYIGAGGFYDTFSEVSGFKHRQYGFTGTVTGALGDSATLKSITAYTNTRYNTISDLDASPYPFLELLSYPLKARQFSQEVQVYGDALDGKLQWIAGVYYFQVNASQITRFAFATDLFGPANTQQSPYVKNTSASAFAQLTYEVAPGLRLTGGLRYVEDKRHTTYRDHLALGNMIVGNLDGDVLPDLFLQCQLANAPQSPNPAACVYEASVKYNYLPWTVGIDYKPNNDILLYAKASKGFRSGAFPGSGPQQGLNNVTQTIDPVANAQSLALFGPVAPERLISYEAGAKIEAFDRHLRVNTAVYWSSYNNIQQIQNRAAPSCQACTPIAVLLNSGKAEIWGGELEVTALLGKLTLQGQLSYTHAEYVSGVSVGQPLVQVPAWAYSFGATYPIDTAYGTITLNGNYSYLGKSLLYAVDPAFPQAAPYLSQPGYGLFDARASWELKGTPLTFSVFGQNLADKKYNSGATSFASAGLAFTIPGTPRTFGVEIMAKF